MAKDAKRASASRGGRTRPAVRSARLAAYDRPAGAPNADWDKWMVELEKKIPKSRKISSKPAYIPVAAPFGRCDRAQGLFGEMYSGTPGLDAPGLI